MIVQLHLIDKILTCPINPIESRPRSNGNDRVPSFSNALWLELYQPKNTRCRLSNPTTKVLSAYSTVLGDSAV